jgi:GT2 family glycosyltransferase
LLSSRFFDQEDQEYYGCLEIFVVDNASELVLDEKHEKLHLIKNRNTGGSGGFQRGIEEIRKYDNFTHVIFMDDDVTFELSCFYILYNFLKNVDEDNSDRPIAGRMLDKDNPNIQWTVA